ncbi:DUF6351 family protein [Parahaliea aestuarii]|uniref:DUF6351 domain-containing protein n=1 Tax=Parahaliea aestuarii TaxID=1852021 RepID=A0A5C8ZNI2_9GAMM|nr:DUF6351 family protein [Parahaliea aestuarii]TXS89189.1 hypothetical protein FVW59_18880 [Parahaliea aestuarii]
MPRLPRLTCLAVLLGSLTLAGCSDSSDSDRDGGGGEPGPSGELILTVLSGDPAQVSNGEARIAIDMPEGLAADEVSVEVEGRDVSDAFTSAGDNRLEGRVDGLAEGDNQVTATSSSDNIEPATLTLTNHPASGPIFSGPQQTPFFCAVDDDLANLELGPILDEQCSVETVVSYKYRTTGGAWADYSPGQERPEDMATTTTIDGDEVDFIVRWERGSLNRFLYSLAVLVPAPASTDDEPDLDVWNERLIYYFQGGVAIGHYQGDPSLSRALYVDGLAAGYAVAYSTGTKTGTHYNLELGGETALMVKSRFVAGYGVPDYTVGVGGSGGGIQQYVYAQNHPGLIDAGVPQYSYPDMVTQTIHIGDCELLERWMDLQVLDDPASKWATWENRTWLIGLNANSAVPNDVVDFGLTPWLLPGSTECTASWRGLSPLALNPHFGEAPGITAEQQAEVEWTHFADLINIYGRAEDGFATTTWDNVGVQYGLQALRDGNISPEEFLDLNWEVGSWKNEPEMVQEGCPFIIDLCFALDDSQPLYPDQIDPWSWRNATTATDSEPAPRKAADPGAIAAAFDSGMVNHGNVEIPLIDLRHYLEEELDMHNTHQSFAARQRLLDFDDDASNQVIWFVDRNPDGVNFDNTMAAFAVLDEWIANIRADPEASVGENRPEGAVDSCFASDGSLIASGDAVWDGILDDNPPGACTQRFPLYSTSRIVAGAPITGDVFKCQLQSVTEAFQKDLYGNWNPTREQLERLETIFPNGVCDYSLPGVVE